MAAIPLGGSAKLNLNINLRIRTGIHGARTRHHQVSHLQLHFPTTTQFSCHCSVSFSSSPDLTNPAPLLQREDGEGQELGIMCEACEGKGWRLCDFCDGQKTNVQGAKSNRVYRRCPTCKAVGCILCEKCKVYKCVTLPDFDDVAQL